RFRALVARSPGSGEVDAAAVVDRRPVCPRDVPDVPFRVAPAEAAAPERLARLLEQLDAVDRPQRLVDLPALVEGGEVHAQHERAEPVRRPAEVPLVVAPPPTVPPHTPPGPH